jgi:hypothetical protein
MRPTKIAVLAAALAAACAYNPPPVALHGQASDLERLAGRWRGSYEGGRGSRSGSIELVLLAGEDHAHGDVVMVARGSRHGYRRWRDAIAMPAPEVDVLTIRFVAVEDGYVSGALDAYRDPTCDCRAQTTFRGRLSGNVIEGTFITHTAVGGPAHGRWKVRRQRG